MKYHKIASLNKNSIIVIFIFFVFFFVLRAYGQEGEEPLPPLEPSVNAVQKLEEVVDPFRSFLPVAEEEIHEVPVHKDVVTNVEELREEVFDYSTLSVSGLVWGTDKPKAIINGEIYSKGDIINKAKILDISKEGILFKYNDKEYLMKRNL